MSTDEKQANGQDQAQPAPGGAFTKDKQFGNRLDQVMALGEPFLLLGGLIENETIETKFGAAEVAKVLVQKLNRETGAPTGPPLKANTVATAIVEKVKNLTPEELAQGPIVQLQVVQSKGRGGQNALVLSWMRNLADGDDFSEFGLSPDAVGDVVNQARPAGERIPY